MTSVTVSPKFQVVIPKAVRERLDIAPGQKLQVFALENQILLVPEVPIASTRGFLKGRGVPPFEREADRL